METEPYVMDFGQIGKLLDKQEKIGKTFQNTQDRKDMDKFILEEVIGEEKSSEEAQVEIQLRASKQNNQVCCIFLFLYIPYINEKIHN